ncbi:NTP transferase domain-containing protein [Arcanobacterium urinimassiliense]|uniref:NTP transferase domain-containing protein n=1 Tax=Arcanobacterium urinimassiliense TaxID=1871014 RepID=UPI0009400704|nr:NTP transferase domain-containing protein [Arcanobacterium urinimassiliense]
MAAENSLSAAIILAAGKGTRIKSQTPKVLLEMCGRSLLGHAYAAVAGLNPDFCVFVVRHEKEKVAAHIAEIAPQGIIAEQDAVKGTGRAAWCGMQALAADLQGPVLILAGDSPMFSTEALAELLAAHSGKAVTVLSTVVENPHGYGRILREAGEIVGIVEEKDATVEQKEICEIATSTYVFDAAFLREALATLGTDNAQGEMYLTDVVARAAASGRGVGSYVLADSVQAEGVNDLVQLAGLRKEKNARILDKWMRSGVSIVDPLSTWIDAQVQLAPDVRIEPNTILRGNTQVAEFTRLGPSSDLRNVQVGAYCHLPYTVADTVEVPPHTQVNPFTVLSSKRPIIKGETE